MEDKQWVVQPCTSLGCGLLRMQTNLGSIPNKVKARVPSTIVPYRPTPPKGDATQHGRRHAGKRFSAFLEPTTAAERERERVGD